MFEVTLCQNVSVPQKYGLLPDLCIMLDKLENLPGELAFKRKRWKIDPSDLRSSHRRCKANKILTCLNMRIICMKCFVYRYEWGSPKGKSRTI